MNAATPTVSIRQIYDFQSPIHQLNRVIDAVKQTNEIYESLLCPQNPLVQKTNEAWDRTYSEFEQVFNGKTYMIFGNEFTEAEVMEGFEEVRCMAMCEIKKYEARCRSWKSPLFYDYQDPGYRNMPCKLKYWICRTFLQHYYPEMNMMETVTVNRIGLLHQDVMRSVMYCFK